MTTLWLEEDMMPGPEPLGLRVLVVEDNVDCAESTATVLRILGHSVEIAMNGPTALAMADVGKPDVVLLDLGLPGMNGYEVAKHLNEKRSARTPLIIAVSGYGPDAGKPQPGKTGIDLHLMKPAKTQELYEVLSKFKRLLDESPADPEAAKA